MSRCQRFDFRRIGAAEISARLRDICKTDGYACEESALQVISQRAEGSMRDAESLLEQVLAFSGGKATEAEIAPIVGLRGSEAEVDSIMLGLGLPPAIRDTAAGPDYTVGHASQVIAFPPGDGFRVIYPFGTRQADWKHDLTKLLNR